MPVNMPIPPSSDSSQALLRAFAERGIRFIPNRRVHSLDPERRVAILEMRPSFSTIVPGNSKASRAGCLGVQRHDRGWLDPVGQKTLQKRFPGIYATGDVTSVGTSKAGVIAEGAA